MLSGALRRVVDSQLAYVKKPTAAGRVEAAMAHRWLWVLPTLLLRVPPSTEAADENVKTAGARKRESLVIDRVKLIEADHALDLLETYVAEMENPTTNQDQNMLLAWTDAQQKNYTRAVRKAVDGGLKQAKVALESGPEVPRDESTMLELCRLVAVDVDDAERRAQTLAAMRARALHAACPTLRMKHLRSRVWRLKSVASPGPSGWRNTHVQAVARTRGGMQLLMQWVMLWARAKATPDLAETWTAALVHPVDCGDARTPPGEPARRKLRPIACSEALMKLAETIVIDANESQLRTAMRPHQLGCGVPDGAVLIVSATRAWASEMQRKAKAEIDHPTEDGTRALEQSVMGIDMENAYGRVLRSSCIFATLELAPGLAALTGSQWQRPVQAWLKVGDRWVQRPTERGGWQGARLMQILYSLALEWRMARGAQEWGLEAGRLPAGIKWAAPGATGRMGYQDDQYLYGRAVDLARALSRLDESLAQDGHRVRRDKMQLMESCHGPPGDCEPNECGRHQAGVGRAR